MSDSVVSKRKMQWVENSADSYKLSGGELILLTAKCSVCGRFTHKLVTFGTRLDYNFCPYCGRKRGGTL